jgi:hypothetical protein
MQSTLSSNANEDPCDAVVVAPDAIRVVPSDEELSSLLHEVARYRSDTEMRTASDFKPGPSAPAVDAMVRPASANDVHGSQGRRSIAAQVARAIIAFLLAACVSLAAVAWKSYGDVAKKTIAMLATQFFVPSSEPEKPALAAQPASPVVQVDAANAASPQPAPLTQTVPNAVAPAADSSPDSAQLLQSMAHDLAALRQDVEELKAGMEQIKASRQQVSRDVAKAPEQNLRPAISALPPRPAAPQTRKPAHSSSPPYAAAATPALPPATAPYYPPRQPDYYVPRQPEPQSQTTFEPPADTQLSPVPRPPMPLR